MTFDPIDVVYSVLSNNFDWSSLDVEIKKEYDVKGLDLRIKSYIVIGSVRENDAFLGLGAKEYMRNIAVGVMVLTSESRSKARQIVNKIRDIFRNKDNWTVDGVRHLNFNVEVLVDRSDYERNIFTHEIEVGWLVVEP